MKRLLSLALLGIFSAALAGCEASAKVDTDGRVDADSGRSYSRTTVKREAPSGDTTYERRTESRTTINP